ncbi:ATP-grasp domain-containing protein [Azorhizobium doebereinerae]|uniref:ATP-grasp domain-containing protein n=1 Tax=Azorhizobium doebereinerae TaxID=281091 RepID=UPI0003F7FC92|nr:ATP-grasp domain-containing protein [Azorhizobium doebereinerae]
MDLAIIALCARPFVASAARAGLSPLSLDLFANLDTCAKAARCVRVHRANGHAFDGDDLIAALTNLAPAGLPVVLGGGLEDDPALMARIAARNPILGNGTATMQVLKDPLALAALCGTLQVPFPEATLNAPDAGFAARPVLEKKIGGSGGGHIRRRAAGDLAPPPPGFYLQQEVTGEIYSLLLLANGRQAVVVGACRQWHAPDAAHPYRYGGMVGPVALPTRHAAAITAAGRDIATACGLVGLVSVDLVVGADGWWLVEVTPRLSAMLDIFDCEPLPPLLALHLAACGGRMPDTLPAPKEHRACAVLYAADAVVIPDGQWPATATDRPAPGTAIKAGAPICTVHASGPTAAAAEDQLGRRLAEVRGWLGLETVDMAV